MGERCGEAVCADVSSIRAMRPSLRDCATSRTTSPVYGAAKQERDFPIKSRTANQCATKGMLGIDRCKGV